MIDIYVVLENAKYALTTCDTDVYEDRKGNDIEVQSFDDNAVYDALKGIKDWEKQDMVEYWVNLYPDGTATHHEMEQEANEVARPDRIGNAICVFA